MKLTSQIFSIIAILLCGGFSILALLAYGAPLDMLTPPSIVVAGGLIGLAISTKDNNSNKK